MELAALPGRAAKHRAARRLQSLMGIADDQLDTGQAALHQTLEQLAPMRFVFTNRDREAQNDAFAIVAQPHGDQTAASRACPSMRTFS